MKWLKALAAFTFVTILAACGGNSNSNATDITVLIGKPEIATEFEAMVNEFNDSHDDINVEIMPLAGQNAFERMTTLYSSGSAPTIMMMGDEINSFQDRLLDLSDQPWVEEAYEGTLDFAEFDGSYYGMPTTVEAFGFLYNEDVVNEAVGGPFDPATINTQDALRDLMESIAALDNIEATQIASEGWSLGAHWTNLAFTNQAEESEGRHQFMEDLKAGEVSLADNEIFNGWLDTFDLTMEFNAAQNAPLAADFDGASMGLSTGEIGLWFMGNWAYPPLFELNPDVNYGIMPVPISNNPDDYGNTQISVGVPAYWVVDADQSTEAEQEAAKEFLNWMVSSEEGQNYYVNEFKFLPIFNNMDITPEDLMSTQILEYMEAGNTLEWMNLYYPPDAYPTMGDGAMQMYLGGEIDRAELTEEFQTYWESK